MEHLLPRHVAFAAGGAWGERIYSYTARGGMPLDAFAFY